MLIHSLLQKEIPLQVQREQLVCLELLSMEFQLLIKDRMEYQDLMHHLEVLLIIHQDKQEHSLEQVDLGLEDQAILEEILKEDQMVELQEDIILELLDQMEVLQEDKMEALAGIKVPQEDKMEVGLEDLLAEETVDGQMVVVKMEDGQMVEAKMEIGQMEDGTTHASIFQTSVSQIMPSLTAVLYSLIVLDSMRLVKSQYLLILILDSAIVMPLQFSHHQVDQLNSVFSMYQH
jgi:hypothetical protein